MTRNILEGSSGASEEVLEGGERGSDEGKIELLRGTQNFLWPTSASFFIGLANQ